MIKKICISFKRHVFAKSDIKIHDKNIQYCVFQRMLFAMLAYSFFLKPSYLCFEDATSINTKMSLEIIGSVKITSASTKPLLHEEEAEDAPHQNVLSQI